MIYLKLKPNLSQLLEDLTDFETEEPYKGTDYVEASADLQEKVKNGETRFPLVSIEQEAELGLTEIYVKIGDFNDPVHESWIEAIEIDGVAHEIATTDSWDFDRLIKLKTQHHFFNLRTKEIIFNDACCSECGEALETPTEDGVCSACIDKLTKTHEYSYKPEPKFKKLSTENTEEFYGLELEYGFNSKREALKLIKGRADELYLKSDSSIRGGSFRAEVVSHPHSFAKLMSDDSFINELDKIGVEYSTNNGCHIHISRKAFKDRKHFALFYFLLHSSKSFLEHVGGRSLNEFCEFNVIGKIHTKKNERQSSTPRHSVLNENNANTVEVRIFTSSNSTTTVKRYIQFVDSLIQFTKTEQTTVSLAKYLKYVAENKEKYSELHSHIKPFSAKGTKSIKFRDPITKQYTFATMTLEELASIAEIETTCGKIFAVSSEHHINFSIRNNTLEFVGRQLPDTDITTIRLKPAEIKALRTLKWG